MLRPRVRLLKVHHLSAASVGEVARELEVRAEAGDSHEKADDPVDKSKADRSRVGENRTGCKYISMAHDLPQGYSNSSGLTYASRRCPSQSSGSHSRK